MPARKILPQTTVDDDTDHGAAAHRRPVPLAVGTADQALDVLVTVRLDPLGGAV